MACVDFQALMDFVYVCPRLMRSREAAQQHEQTIKRGEVPLAPQPSPSVRARRRLVQAWPERLPRLEPGTRVELTGAHHELSGRIVEIVGWDEAKGLYEVQDVPPKYWTCPKCGEINKRVREACNGCFAVRAGGGELAAGRRFSVPPPALLLPVGTEVAVDGLADFEELNGQEGCIRAFDRRAGRYHVELSDGRIRAIRPPHVVARRPPAEEAEFGRWAAPAEAPSHVDEPEPPDEVPCASEDELRKLVEELDDDWQLKRDIEVPAPGPSPGGGRSTSRRLRLRRGQQLVREGELAGRKLADLRRRGDRGGQRSSSKGSSSSGGAGRVGPPIGQIRLRFTRHRPIVLRLGPRGPYAEAVLRLDTALAALLQADLSRQRLPRDCFSFFGFAQPGWAGPSVRPPQQQPAARAERASKGWAGWVCPDCGHVNDAGTDFCTTCEPDEG